MSTDGELATYAGLFIYGISYALSGSKDFAFVTTIYAAGAFTIYIFLCIGMINHEFDTPYKWIKGNYMNILKNIGKVFLGVPLSLIGISNGLLSVKSLRMLSVEWDINGLSYNAVIFSIATSVMFLSFAYILRQSYKLMDY